MMVTANALCDDRIVHVRARDITLFPWDDFSYLCCDACVSIAKTRDSWWEVYG